MFLDQDRKTEQLFDRLIHADIGYVKKGLGHYVENTGETDLMYMEVFRAERFEEVSLSDWLAHSPVDLVAETLNLDPAVIARFPKNRPDVVPA